MNPSAVFTVRSKKDFENKAIEIFYLQADKNPVYKIYIEQLGINAKKVKHISQIPFLPIEFFKSHKVVTSSIINHQPSTMFQSSGTTGIERSRHYVSDISHYEKSFRKGFEIFYGDIKQYSILALLPSYYENKNSSLIYMVMDLIKRSDNKYSAFYNLKDENIAPTIQNLLQKKQKVMLFGVSFALLDFFPDIKKRSGDLIVLETGGMKGRKEEITRDELHKILCEKFGVKKIHSEYGMTELLSQAYSNGNGIFKCPPWMKIFAREVNDPFQITGEELRMKNGFSGAINVIDLANINSCSFIATQDLGKVYRDGSFKVLGRMDNSDLRGCNLMIGN